jgi:hypothetical protein
MTIEPDIKDWTWVLQRPCAECGFEAADIVPTEIASRIRDNGSSWVEILTGEVSLRPSPDVWSPLEYACHVRDVMRVMHGRLMLMLTEDDPLFDNWDQDETAVSEHYSEQNPQQVSAELAAAAEIVASEFANLNSDQWPRTGRRGGGSVFTVESLGKYFLHDIEHHLHDVRR